MDVIHQLDHSSLLQEQIRDEQGAQSAALTEVFPWTRTQREKQFLLNNLWHFLFLTIKPKINQRYD